ncbi:hypothetical protein IQ235_01185 [Oscillatoriales cyanobacterium LEGE 11467]|uniref:Uncharacterized protein n=1 Tax=Zarconia navalis LEGE 11467 TaxID=1828826 RepID=A0A928VS66_9CYAN|nr:hypothetical protein [Zarconia navalis]MBE9039409.1 hypothetical protein [Zarconia navalis LEGE 11467]
MTPSKVRIFNINPNFRVSIQPSAVSGFQVPDAEIFMDSHGKDYQLLP